MKIKSDLLEHRRGRAPKLAALFSLFALAAALVVVPSASASAEVIDCSYSPGLGSWIGAGGAPGVKCAGGGSGVGTNPGPGSANGGIGNPGQRITGAQSCTHVPPEIPDDFYNHGPILSYYSERQENSVLVQTRDFYRNGKFVGETTVLVKDGWPEDVYFDDLTLAESRAGGVVLSYHVNCDSQDEWVPVYANTSTVLHQLADMTELSAPGTPTASDAPAEVLTHASLTPIPSSPNKFFLRVDVTNNKTTASDADIDLDLSSFALQGVVSMPGDASCPFATAVDERCTFPNVAAGATETMMFVVKADASSSTTATLPIRTSFPGYVRLGARSTAYELSRWGTVTVDKMPTL
jgi:hypothetical protein